MARALVVEWPDDPTTWPIADQWLLGDALLVAPILDSTHRRRVYLPAGTWTDWRSGARIAGPRWIEVEAALDVLPLWVREGHVVALGPSLEWVGERPTDTVELHIAPFTADGETSALVAVDEERVQVRYAARDGAHRVAIGPSRARFEIIALGAGAPSIELPPKI